MIFTKNKPKTWLDKLNTVLSEVECRQNGDQISFDAAVEGVGKIFLKSLENGAFVWWAANGGSASICSHLSQDLMNKIGIKSFFGSDPSLITCMANDYGYDQVYARPLKTLASEKDVLIAISSSGNSANIINAANLSIEKGMELISFSGFDATNKLYSLNKGVSFYLPSKLYGIVEVGHEALLHSIIESFWLEKKG